MSGNPRGLGYKRANPCKYCGHMIIWQKTGDTTIPFEASVDEQGNAFKKGIHECSQKPFSLRKLGEIDTALKKQWLARNIGSQNPIGAEDWDATKRKLATALIGPGSPFPTWKHEDVIELFRTGDRNAVGHIYQVGVQRAVLNRIHGVVHGVEYDFEDFDQLKPITIRGIHIVVSLPNR